MTDCGVRVDRGALCQAVADGPSMFWLLMVGRVLLGLGGEVTPFTSVEILGKLFPDYFGLMAGVRNLIQSTCGFLAFVLLPMWAESGSSPEPPAGWNATIVLPDGTVTQQEWLDNDGTSYALWITVWLGIASTFSNCVVKYAMVTEQATAENSADQKSIQGQIRAFGRATAPLPPGSCAKWQLPLSFYLACVGIKAQYFAPFGFTAFSNTVYGDKFGQTKADASFFSGVISLVAGLLGPIMGPWSDKQVSFQWKNPDFLFKNHGFLLKNVDFMIKTGPAVPDACEVLSRVDVWVYDSCGVTRRRRQRQPRVFRQRFFCVTIRLR